MDPVSVCESQLPDCFETRREPDLRIRCGELCCRRSDRTNICPFFWVRPTCSFKSQSRHHLVICSAGPVAGTKTIQQRGELWVSFLSSLPSGHSSSLQCCMGWLL